MHVSQAGGPVPIGANSTITWLHCCKSISCEFCQAGSQGNTALQGGNNANIRNASTTAHLSHITCPGTGAPYALVERVKACFYILQLTEWLGIPALWHATVHYQLHVMAAEQLITDAIWTFSSDGSRQNVYMGNDAHTCEAGHVKLPSMLSS